MRRAYGVEQVRRAEAALMATLPPGTLMQRAAAGLAAACSDLLGRRVYGRRVTLLVGSGDNGGDALFAGARLATRGAQVHALLLDPARAHPEGLAALRDAGGRGLAALGTEAARLIQNADLVVDGIVGIGAAGPLRPPAAALVGLLAGAPAQVVAVDVPSGVDPDTGAVTGPAVRADVTVTFGLLKPGLLVDPGASHAGVVHLVEIGLPAPGPEPAPVAAFHLPDVAALLPAPVGPEVDKYRRGVLGVLAGSDAYTGAAALAVGGGLRGGAGMVRFFGPDRAAAVVRARWPEAVIAGDFTATEPGSVSPAAAAARVQAWVAGPGMGTDTWAQRRLDAVLAADAPVVLDADALTLLAARGALDRAAPTLLTPHSGEAARLLGHTDRDEVEANRLAAVRALAAKYGATVLLKGSTTLVAAARAPVLANPTGTGWLATAGSGDVLAGLCGALMAAGLGAAEAGAVGAYLHGLAGRLAAERGVPITASDVLDHLPSAWLRAGSGLG